MSRSLGTTAPGVPPPVSVVLQSSTGTPVENPSVAPALVKFDVEKATHHLQQKEWDLLETYLLEFLGHAQSENMESHPGLFYPVYEAYILELISQGFIDDAKAIFKLKVAPLAIDIDSPYRPIDLRLCIENLENNIKTRSSNGALQDVTDSVVRYIQLYFPQTLSHTNIDILGKDSVHRFLAAVSEEGVIHYKCLACNWPIPIGKSPLTVSSHIKHIKDFKRCPKVTQMMLKLLASIEKSEEMDMSLLATKFLRHPYASKRPSKSLSGPPVAPGQSAPPGTSESPGLSGPPTGESEDKTLSPGPQKKQHHRLIVDPRSSDYPPSVLVDPTPSIKVISNIQTVNMKIVTTLQSLRTSTGDKMEQICVGQAKQISRLSEAFCDARSKGHRMNGYAVFAKLEFLSLAHGQTCLLLQDVPPEISVLVLKKDRLIDKLRFNYLKAISKPTPAVEFLTDIRNDGSGSDNADLSLGDDSGSPVLS